MVRGVNSDGILAKLAERGLIEERGKADSPGRPILYGTTDLFLKSIGISDLSELPDITLAEQDEEAQDIYQEDEQ
jgi:segregation and condensation protein B